MSGFYKIEVNKTVWEVPERYQMLQAVGSGAYGQVWYVLDTYIAYFYEREKGYVYLNRRSASVQLIPSRPISNAIMAHPPNTVLNPAPQSTRRRARRWQ